MIEIALQINTSILIPAVVTLLVLHVWKLKEALKP
ncbi:hypothetical protein LCGC14_2854990 [marine sediment metagenome]|uniref:Uncharacterized protein n=1 Tax=marine sediment metagenome TaxID=412755 RepID=A0A0F8Y773_9ZZZZ